MPLPSRNGSPTDRIDSQSRAEIGRVVASLAAAREKGRGKEMRAPPGPASRARTNVERENGL